MLIQTHATLHRWAAACICSAVLLTLACPSVLAVQDCEFNGQHINTSNGFETAGKTGMVRCKDRDTSQRMRI